MLPTPNRPERIQPPEEVGLIQGQPPGSLPEWRVAVALEKLKVRYIYQFVIYGGSSLRGGLVVDFVVYTPFMNGLEIFGQYWHKGEIRGYDRIRLDQERNYFQREPFVLLENELGTQEDAMQAVRETLQI